MAENVIVLRNGEYVLEEKREDYIPENIVLSSPGQPRYSHQISSASITLRNLIKVTLDVTWYFNEPNSVTVTYKNIIIDSVNGGIGKAFAFILTFKDCTNTELDDLVKSIKEEQDKQKESILDNRISELELEKNKLEEEVKELNKIKQSADKIIEYAKNFKNALSALNTKEITIEEK